MHVIAGRLVEVVAHQAVSMDLEFGFEAGFGQGLDEVLPIDLIQEPGKRPKEFFPPAKEGVNFAKHEFGEKPILFDPRSVKAISV